MADYEIIAYRPEFKDQVVALYSDAFRLERSECRKYLEWKYERNPYLPEPLLSVAQDGRGSIVGMRGFYGTCWRIAGQRVVIPCADDFAISLEARNTGLMTAIMRSATETLAQRGFDLLLNASGGTVTVLNSLATGWKSLGAMEPVARLDRLERFRRALHTSINGKRFVWRYAGDIRRGDPACFARLDRSRRRSVSHGDVVVGSSPRAEAMAQLIDRRPVDGRIRHVRDAAFFRWRFDNPTREYRFLYHERNGVLTGFLVVARYRQYGYTSMPFNIVDWEAQDDQTGSELLKTTLAWGRFPAIGTWSALLSSDNRKMLANCGFAPSELDRRARGMPCVLLKKLGPTGTHTGNVDSATWDIHLIDSMHG